MTINEKAQKILKDLNNNFYIVSDFDRTITTGNSLTSWSILANTNLVPQDYIQDRNKLYNYYRPIEIDNTIPFSEKKDLMQEWFNKHLQLFIKYKLPENVFKSALANNKVMQFRLGAKEYLNYLYTHNTPLIIISAGIGNFIEQFLLLNSCYYDNIFINANYIQFDNGIANLVNSNIIHSLNKDEYQTSPKIQKAIEGKKYVLLFGDQIEDIKMINPAIDKNVIKIGFLIDKDKQEEYEEYFDIVVDDNESYLDILKLL